MNTREKIISAARELFEQKGFAAATTKEIASLAGISEVTLFRHFGTKRGLFDETLHSCIHPYTVADYLKNGVTYDLSADLKHIAYDMMATYRKNAPLIKIVMRDKTRSSEPELRARNDENNMECNLKTYFSAMQQAGRIKADPAMALRFFITNITGCFFKELFGDSTPQGNDDYFEWMLDKIIMVLQGEGKDQI